MLTSNYTGSVKCTSEQCHHKWPNYYSNNRWFFTGLCSCRRLIDVSVSVHQYDFTLNSQFVQQQNERKYHSMCMCTIVVLILQNTIQGLLNYYHSWDFVSGAARIVSSPLLARPLTPTTHKSHRPQGRNHWIHGVTWSVNSLGLPWSQILWATRRKMNIHILRIFHPRQPITSRITWTHLNILNSRPNKLRRI